MTTKQILIAARRCVEDIEDFKRISIESGTITQCTFSFPDKPDVELFFNRHLIANIRAAHEEVLADFDRRIASCDDKHDT